MNKKSIPTLRGAIRRGDLFKRNSTRGFTIVELLIVVVVIAILAAITIVSYNGITGQAKDSTLKSNLATGAKKLHIDKINNGSFPITKPDYLDDTIQYTSDGNTFCVTASRDGRAFYTNDTGTVETGTCSGHTVDGVVGEIAANSPIQNVTQAQCQALPVFTGGNNEAVRTVTDVRGGTTRTYEIAKLADGKCWMLTNLKLGSTSSSITLTSVDSNIASNFTLPQLTTAGTGSSDNPRAYGPVPGDTGTGLSNYGYFYNWSAATAGESRASHGQSAGNAPYSICPASWRLPASGSWNAATNEFSNLNARMAGLSGVADPGYTSSGHSGGAFSINWGYDGPFRSLLPGNWSEGSFDGETRHGSFWSSSASPSAAYDALGAYFDVSGVSPSDIYYRDLGMTIRCILN